MKKIKISIILIILLMSLSTAISAQSLQDSMTKPDSTKYSLENCINEFSMDKAEKTNVGSQYWFIDKDFLDGRTIKLSVVGPHSAIHPPHVHPEDEFFFILEGKAEFYLNGKTKIVGPYTICYAPPNVRHGIKNAGDTELKYLVIKKYDGYLIPDTSIFFNSAHHWYDIYDEGKVIEPPANQPKYTSKDYIKIADNILLYQKNNGGWPKNYDMLAILTDEQKAALMKVKDIYNTTFDNWTTHSHVDYLAQVYTNTRDEKYMDACLKGIDFMLSTQYPNGGWPQGYPDTSDYVKYITYNDGVMTGIMTVFYSILQNKPDYFFVDAERRKKIQTAFDKGMDCILKCQIKENNVLNVWPQQSDNIDFHPQWGRTFEPPAICNQESADLVLFLMSIDNPSKEIINSIQSAVKWFEDSKIFGIRWTDIPAPTTKFKWRTSSIDRVVVKDSTAPPIWTRYYELGTHRPLFCDREYKIFYTLAEVGRERRSGYTWYTYEPQIVLDQYSQWQKKWVPDNNVLKNK
jgi:PelA/Pel-15E family pectate lyase